MNTFRILEDNLERLHKKINRIRTKCNKYGCDFFYEEVGEEFTTWTDEAGEEHTAKYILVECEGTAKINGWKFAATIQHEDAGNIIRNIIDIEVPARYRTCAPECEHCKSARHRKNTYLVYNEDTQEFKQVGSACLCDFTGGYSAELAAEYIALFDELIQGEAPVGGVRPETYYPIRDMLKYAVKLVDQIGYMSASAAEYAGRDAKTTRELVRNSYIYDNYKHTLFKSDLEWVEDYRESHDHDYDSEENMQRVEDILNYIKGLEDDSEYIHNLKVLADAEYIRWNQLGYAVSMVPCYNRYIRKVEAEQKQQKEAEESTSTFVGKEGERINFVPTSIEAITSWESMYGMTTRYKMYDEAGNCYMWDSSTGIYDDRDLEGNKVEVAKIVGTVKKHDEFRGIKQTWLTRCKVSYNIVEEFKEPRTGSSEAEDAVEDFLNFVNA